MIQVYQAGDGRWIVLNNEIKRYFTTRMEAETMSEKITYAESAQDFSTTISQLIEQLPMFQSVYADRGYGLGGVDEITDIDLESLGITAAELAAFITPFTNQLFNFANNLAVTTGDYSVTLNRLRTDI